MNYNFYMDIELLASEVNIYSNGKFIKKYILHKDIIYYITFKFKHVIYPSELESCYYDFSITDKYPNERMPSSHDYILIISLARLNEVRLKLKKEYVVIGPSNYISLIKDGIVLKQGSNIASMQYFFDTLCCFSLNKVNNIWLSSGKDIIDTLLTHKNELLKAKEENKYDLIMQIIKEDVDFFNIYTFITKFPKQERKQKLYDYIDSIKLH